MIDKVIEKITAQQAGKEGTAVWAVGEQLKDICRCTPKAAELVLQDLENKSMSISECEKKIKAYADELHTKSKGNSVGVSFYKADEIIREFYGLPDISEEVQESPNAAAAPQSKGIDIDFDKFFG